MKHIKQIVLGIAILTTLGLSTTAVARCDGGKNTPQYCEHGQGMMNQSDMSGKGGHLSSTMLDKHFDKLKADLKITATQETAWQTFITKSKQQAEETRTMREKMQPGANSNAISAPERMEKNLEMMKQRMAHMEAMSAALKEFYAVLTPEQKTVADTHFSHMTEKRRDRIRSAIKDAK